MNEAELRVVLMHARAGDAEAFAELYRRFHRRVFNLCRYMLGSAEAAEDAVNDVFLRVQKRMDTYDDSLPFEHWLSRVASHYCVDLLRRRRTERRLFGAEERDIANCADSGPPPLAALISSERKSAVRKAVESLPDSGRP